MTAGAPTPGGLEVAGATDRGPVRAENQDAWAAVQRGAGSCLLLLADGMGGHAEGGVAARRALEASREVLCGTPGVDPSPVAAVNAATAAVQAHRDAIGQPTGTTLVTASIRDRRATITNVGDSRAYLVREGSAIQLTEDHSVYAEALRRGVATDGSTWNRNVLSRAVTGDPVTPDVIAGIGLRPGDVLLLCSDGLWEPLGDAVAVHFQADRSLRECVEAACTAALRAGATDNVTVVAARVD